MLLADFVNRADVGMVQGGSRRASRRNVPGLRIARHLVGQKLERDKAASRVSSAL